MKTVAILCAAKNSVYKSIPGAEVYDIERDARTFAGGMPVVAHPPCGTWGKLRKYSSGSAEEHDLAYFCLQSVRKNGGVLEHPTTSKLWVERDMPGLGSRDGFDGWILPVLQWWFGHRAEKATRLYFVGLKPVNLPQIPFRLGWATHVVSSGYSHGVKGHGHRSNKPEISKSERLATPKAFAEWLVECARRTNMVRLHTA